MPNINSSSNVSVVRVLTFRIHDQEPIGTSNPVDPVRSDSNSFRTNEITVDAAAAASSAISGPPAADRNSQGEASHASRLPSKRFAGRRLLRFPPPGPSCTAGRRRLAPASAPPSPVTSLQRLDLRRRPRCPLLHSNLLLPIPPLCRSAAYLRPSPLPAPTALPPPRIFLFRRLPWTRQTLRPGIRWPRHLCWSRVLFLGGIALRLPPRRADLPRHVPRPCPSQPPPPTLALPSRQGAPCQHRHRDRGHQATRRGGPHQGGSRRLLPHEAAALQARRPVIQHDHLGTMPRWPLQKGEIFTGPDGVAGRAMPP